MSDMVEEYLINEGAAQRIASRLSYKLKRHQDLYEECCSSIQNGSYPTTDAIEIEGFSASDIHERAPFMNIAGVYGFLVSLREDPDPSKEQIKQGFPRK